MSDTTPPNEYTLSALEEASGVSARTIRYYISQGLVPAPLTVGRNASYGEVHLTTLRRIAALKSQGLSLEAIRRELDPRSAAVALPTPQTWLVQQPTDDVAVFVRGDIPPWRRNQIDKALVPFLTAVSRKSSEEG